MSGETGLFVRHAERMASEALADTRVVVVNGARQVGKSSLAELIAARSAGARELGLSLDSCREASGGFAADAEVELDGQVGVADGLAGVGQRLGFDALVQGVQVG